MNKNSKSTQIAIGGVFSALCLLVMFMTGLIPFGTYAFPALAGAMLAIVLIENGTHVALMVYVSVSLLSFFIVPDREAGLMFVMFFGYYPIVKFYFEKLRYKLIRNILKFAVFNAAVISAYYLMINVIGMPDLAQEMGEFGKYSAGIFLLMGNIVFLLYDIALTRSLWVYKIKRKKFIG